MIRGHFVRVGEANRPVIEASFQVPGYPRRFRVTLLVDTGSDYTAIGPEDAVRLARELPTNLRMLPVGHAGTGVGGIVATRTVEGVLTLGDFSTALTLTILEPRPVLPPIPSLLGRDILSRFALVLEERTQRVLLLEPAEADALGLP